jgi:hypothetical protein
MLQTQDNDSAKSHSDRDLEEKISHVTDLGSLHKYRTEMPNIIDELELDLYEFRLYNKYKRIAGDQGMCIKSSRNLAAECKMSVRKLQQVKKSLAEPRELLGGKPLIKITERKTKSGDPDTDLVEIVDIWPDNFLYFIQKSRGGGAPHAPGVPHEMREGTAPGAPKEEQTKEEPNIRTTTASPKKSAARVVVSSHLKEFDLTPKLALELSQYPEEKLVKAIKCIERNGEPVHNVYGFLKRAIEQNWEPKLSDKEAQAIQERKDLEKRELIRRRAELCGQFCVEVQQHVPEGKGITAADNCVTIRNGTGYLPIGYLEPDFFGILARQVKSWGEMFVPRLTTLMNARGCG